MLAMLAPLLSLIGLEADELKQRFKREALIWGLVAGMGLVAISFLLVALYNALSSAMGPIVAPLIIAAVALIVAIGVFLVGRLVESAEAKRAAEKKRNSDVAALITTAAITAIPLLLRSPLMRDIGIPAGAALASALWFRKSDDQKH
jgi:hypothetical protein